MDVRRSDSAESVRKFCKKHGIGPVTLRYWLGHLTCEVEGCGRYSDIPYQILNGCEDPVWGVMEFPFPA